MNFVKIAFITESPFRGKYPRNFINSRTEIAWSVALDAYHFPFSELSYVKYYDHVFVIIPKGRVFLSAEGSKIIDGINPISNLLESNFVEVLLKNNSKVHFIQEGPNSWPLDYAVRDQFLWYNTVASMTSIFCHNEHDKKFYKGMFPDKPVNVISSLMIEDTIKDIVSNPQEKVMIGGNFSRFYGGFNSYMVSDEFKGCSKYTMESHSKRDDEGLIEDLNHLPRLSWTDWIREFSTFKYGVHLMPTVAAGTFSLNAAFLKIPVIGNELMDTQRLLFPELSVHVEDIENARKLARRLYEDSGFYYDCVNYAKNKYKELFSEEVWKTKMEKTLKDL